MKANIFKILPDKYDSLLEKFDEVGLIPQQEKLNNAWVCTLYLSDNPEIKDITWIREYQDCFKEDIKQNELTNKIYFAVYLCKKGDNIFAITYGKSHFYVRNYCDIEFGLKMATRIGNENDVKQVATKRYAGKKLKEIKSFTRNTKLYNESGESVDYISSSIIKTKQVYYGKNSKFGHSMIVTRKDLNVDSVPNLLEDIVSTLEEYPKFDFPKTEIIKNRDDILKYDTILLAKIIEPTSEVTTVIESHDLVGVDFVFSGSEKYRFIYSKNISEQYEELTLGDLRNFININKIDNDNIFKVKIQIENENQNTYSRILKEFIEYTIDDDRIVLQNGKWIKFNDYYVKQINELVDSIEIEETEQVFKSININEPEFNYLYETEQGKNKHYSINKDLLNLGYESSDKDFSQLKIGNNYKVEAWDLRKGDTVYAVKFGSAQKLVYVCNQAYTTLEIIRNKANLNKLNNPPKKYCLWLGLERSVPENISEVNSIILKQQIDNFARKCREIGIEPLLKFSQKQK